VLEYDARRNRGWSISVESRKRKNVREENASVTKEAMISGGKQNKEICK
jgi:hypothetical protein